VHCSGSAEITFEAMLGQLVERMSPGLNNAPTTPHRYEAASSAPAFSALNELIERIRRVTRGKYMLVIDEFDRITDPAMRRQLAETIKHFSDIQARVVLMIVGVATSLDALLGAHPSIQRNILGIHVPLMAPDEVEHLISAGAKAAGITFDPSATETILQLAKGLPYFVQLFCLYAARHALNRNSRLVDASDVSLAAESILEEAEPSLVAAYERATSGAVGKPYIDYLSSIAKADSNAFGAFSWSALKSALPSLSDARLRTVINRLTSDAGGPMLLPAPQHSGQEAVTFVNANMRQYLLLRGFTSRDAEPSHKSRQKSVANEDTIDKPVPVLGPRYAIRRESA